MIEDRFVFLPNVQEIIVLILTFVVRAIPVSEQISPFNYVSCLALFHGSGYQFHACPHRGHLSPCVMRLRKLSIFIGAFTFAVFLSVAFADHLDPRDPILGSWSWCNGGVREFHADGTVTPNGAWRCIDPDLTPRKYEVKWNNGAWIDILYLLKNEKLLKGNNQRGDNVCAKRIGDPLQ